MKYETSTPDNHLELRILELEDTTRALVNIVGMMNDMIGSLNEMIGTYAITLTGVVNALPGAAKQLPFHPVAAFQAAIGTAGGHGAAGANGPRKCANCCHTRHDTTPS